MIRYEKPILQDVAQMFLIAETEVRKGNILRRSEDEIANAIRSYIVAKNGDEIVGFCALYIYTTKLAEVRSLIVKSDFQAQGIGSELVSRILQEGMELGVCDFLVLTYRERFFQRMGFQVIEKTQIPNHKVWTDCIECKHFPKCEEIALLKHI